MFGSSNDGGTMIFHILPLLPLYMFGIPNGGMVIPHTYYVLTTNHVLLSIDVLSVLPV